MRRASCRVWEAFQHGSRSSNMVREQVGDGAIMGRKEIEKVGRKNVREG